MTKLLPVLFWLACLLLMLPAAHAQTPVVSGTLSVSLTGDANSNGQVNPGDQLSYTAVISNTGSGSAAGVNLTMPAPTNTTLVTGSLRTSALARPDAYTTLISGTLSATSVLTNDFGLPTKTVSAFGPSAAPANVVANGSNSSPTDQGGNVVVNTDGTFSYTPTGSFVGYDRFGYTATTTTTLPNDAATVTIGVGTPVTALPNAYTITGNVTNTQSSTATGLLGNDTGDQRVVTTVRGGSGTANVGVAITTVQNGTVTVSANGTFVYEPPAGYTGTDSFTYTANNGLNLPSSAVVTLTIQDMIWFVNSAAGAGGTGTLAKPFNSLNAFQAANNGSGNNPAAGDNIFVYSGTYASTTTPLMLLNDQKLIGQGATASLSTVAGITPAPGSAALPSTGGAAPILNNTASSVVQLGQNNLLRGLAIGTSSVVSLTGNAFG
ncbi:Ig-like domain-containing protein, partial [Spirosoma sp. BT702]